MTTASSKVDVKFKCINLVTQSFADGLVKLGQIVFSYIGGAVAGHVNAVLNVTVLGDLLLDDVGDTRGLKK